jgi:ABC-type transport system involved in Fe-S cluster assembly fused permease/ATPase subunit
VKSATRCLRTVSQRAIRNLALEVFDHLHALSLRYHLERQTGGLSRVIERGTQGMEFLIRFTTFNILPTLLEIALVGGILWSLYDWRFSVVTLVVIAGYVVFSIMLSEWRIKFVRRMNDADTEANAKAIDSLLNYETVKYFGNEVHEARRFDVGRRRYEIAAIRSSRTLSLLNIGQGTIISIGLVAVMVMAGSGVVEGTMTIGDFVAVNTFLIQLYMPLNMLGFAYREIRNALVNMEKMFGLLEVPAEIADRPGRRRSRSRAARSCSIMSISTTSRRGRSCTMLASACRRATRWRSWGRAAPASRPCRASCFGSTTWLRAACASTARTFAT